RPSRRRAALRHVDGERSGLPWLSAGREVVAVLENGRASESGSPPASTSPSACAPGRWRRRRRPRILIPGGILRSFLPHLHADLIRQRASASHVLRVALLL